jgi:UDP-N-acetylmuramyl pentapeptide phosphotransferase/UDP-N-acetylglucosamine-1-phosphate transferase
MKMKMVEYLEIGAGLFVFELAYLLLAKQFGIVDVPHHQSSHTGAIMRGGGIVFYVAYFLWFILSGYQYPMIFAGLTIMAATSFADDIHSISPKVRLVLQFVAMVVMFYETHVFNLPLQPLLLLSVACVGAINIYNFMDGINGLTGGYSIVVLLSLLYVNHFQIEFVDNDLLIYVLMADLIFCLLNFRNHAKCFAGDVGSLSMGFIIIFLLLKLMFKAGHMHWIAFVAVYLVDGGLTIIHRIMLKENILRPHKKHAYQIMANELKISHLKVSLFYMGLQTVCCAWFFFAPSNTTMILQFGMLALLYLGFMQKYYYLHMRKE